MIYETPTFRINNKESFKSDITNNLDTLLHDLNTEIHGNGDVDCRTSIFTNFLCKTGNIYLEKRCYNQKP